MPSTFTATIEIKRACAERIVRAARHATGKLQVTWIATHHVCGRRPGRPLGFAADIGVALQRKTLPADTDAVTHGATIAHDVIEPPCRRIHHHRASRMAGVVGDLLPAKFRLDLVEMHGGKREFLFRLRRIIKPLLADAGIRAARQKQWQSEQNPTT